MTDQQVIDAAQKVYEHTKDECSRCVHPHSCCSPEYCELAQTIALEEWGVDLTPLRREGKLPFLGEKGCVVAPHLRPLCTMHTCDINSLGYKKNDPEWTKIYFKLRNDYEAASFERYQERKSD